MRDKKLSHIVDFLYILIIKEVIKNVIEIKLITYIDLPSKIMKCISHCNEILKYDRNYHCINVYNYWPTMDILYL